MMKMGSKIASFIMTVVTILIITILIFLGLIIYNEVKESNIATEVEKFVSNITISSKNTIEEIKTPQILETTTEVSEKINNDINYNNKTIYKYFYNQLEEYSKIIYNAIESNKDNMKTGKYEINFGTKFSTVLSKENGEKILEQYYQSAIEAYTYDNPDVFYIDFGKMYLNIETTTKGKNKTYKVLINSGNEQNYLTDEFETKEKIEFALNEIEKIKSYFIQNKKTSTYENIKTVHDYLVESIEYDQTISKPNIYNLYGAFINKECVCEGYAKAFKYLMDSLQIPCSIVIGKGINSEGNMENHAWNYVQLNNTWYAIDCTWDDPIIIGGGFLTNSSKYKYFLKGETEFSKTHIPNGQFTECGKIFEFPALSQTNY